MQRLAQVTAMDKLIANQDDAARTWRRDAARVPAGSIELSGSHDEPTKSLYGRRKEGREVPGDRAEEAMMRMSRYAR